MPPPAVIRPLSHHDLLLLLLQMAILVTVARLLGEFARAKRQPPVVGELLAGVLLGPSLFGWLTPDVQAAIFPRAQTQADLLSVLTWLGVLFLLVVTGLETDLNLIISKGRTALGVSLGGISVTFSTGFCLGQLLPDRYLVSSDQRLVFSLFIATAMSITAVPVIAKVLMDLKLIRRDIGQLVLAAAMTDDTVGWVLLSFVAGMAKGQMTASGPILAILSAILFVIAAFTVGRWAVSAIYLWVDETCGGASASLTTLLVLSMLAAALTHELGIEPVLGAFVVGILSGQSPRFSHQAGAAVELITGGFFAPIFFAAAGLKVNLIKLAQPSTLAVGFVVLAIACIGKLIGVYLGARAGRLTHWEGLALGSAMNARGAMEIIVATIGLSLGVLTDEMYSIIVMVAIATSLMAPPLLRYTLKHVDLREDEASRLADEERARLSFVRNIKRVLLPTRGGHNTQLAAELVSHFSHRFPVDVTALYAVSDDSRDEHEAAMSAISGHFHLAPGKKLQTRVSKGRDVPDVILTEAARGYQLLVLGATEEADGKGALFNSIVDRLVRDAPCATLVVRTRDDVEIPRLKHILVPSIGTEYSRHAVELASAVAVSAGAMVTVVYVVIHQDDEAYGEESMRQLTDIAQEIVDRQADLGRSHGAEVDTRVLFGRSSEQAILEFVGTHDVDLMILGSNIRPLSGRAFFGRRVESLLAKAPCPVAVVSST